MKKNLLFLSFTFCLTLAMLNMNAQVKPSHEGLKHLWDFEDIIPLDEVGEAHGEIDSTNLAKLENGKLDLTDGGWVSFPADVIAINTYEAVSIETWATPHRNTNAGNALMMWSFGRKGNPGFYYFFFTPARWAGQVAARLSVGDSEPWAKEDGLAFDASIADSTLYHYVVTLDASRILKIFVNGELLTYGDPATPAIDTLAVTHILDSVAVNDALLGAAVYPDPTWRGTFDLHAIWNVALTADEVKWLYDQGKDRPLSAIIPSAIKPVNMPSPIVQVNDNRLFMRNLPESFTNVAVTIYDITGSVVYKNLDARNGDYLNLKAGIYVTKLEAQGQQFVNKVVIK